MFKYISYLFKLYDYIKLYTMYCGNYKTIHKALGNCITVHYECF